MSEIKEIIEELKNIHDGNAWHGASLKDALNGITCEQAAAHPLKQAHSIWEIVAHIAGWEDVFRRRLEGQMIREPEAGDFPLTVDLSETAWNETLETLYRTHSELLLTIEKLSDSDLERTITGKDYSYGFLLRKTIAHKVYHTGQIAFLKNSFL
ncbi:MAG TPA: DinB family protein [Pyrinomonadaceae bacterium]|jgi:uncharacterized damage-inducible protein DinB